ncbi:MAG: stage II sporulation protein D [Clostridia bacterium]|nr:stage II sporulation protein D [Clostridia bacterium]
MKDYLLMTLLLFLIMVVSPLVTLIDKADNAEPTATISTAAGKTERTEESSSHETVTLMVSSTGKLTEMSAEEYLYGAVCAEMPASFHKEALKAQAVASYTYMKWLKENADNPSQIKADITDNPEIHQAYISDEELQKRWGSSYDIYSEKVKEAVKSVLYEYLAYEKKTAMTVFHGISPGKTVSAQAAWGNEIPYLSSVTAPGDKLSPDITTELSISKEDFVKHFDGAKAENTEEILKGIKTSDEGYVNEITYKKQKLSSADLRSAYNLKSPFLKIESNKSNVLFTVYGKGHGVGMSQYSADYMARQGSTYDEILAHFYKGTELKTQ